MAADHPLHMLCCVYSVSCFFMICQNSGFFFTICSVKIRAYGREKNVNVRENTVKNVKLKCSHLII